MRPQFPLLKAQLFRPVFSSGHVGRWGKLGRGRGRRERSGGGISIGGGPAVGWGTAGMGALGRRPARGGASSVSVESRAGAARGPIEGVPPARASSPPRSPAGSLWERIPGSALSPGRRPASPLSRGDRAASWGAPRSGRAQRQAEESLNNINWIKGPSFLGASRELSPGSGVNSKPLVKSHEAPYALLSCSPLAQCSVATWVFQASKHAERLPAVGSLHLLSPLPGLCVPSLIRCESQLHSSSIVI